MYQFATPKFAMLLFNWAQWLWAQWWLWLPARIATLHFSSLTTHVTECWDVACCLQHRVYVGRLLWVNSSSSTGCIEATQSKMLSMESTHKVMNVCSSHGILKSPIQQLIFLSYDSIWLFNFSLTRAIWSCVHAGLSNHFSSGADAGGQDRWRPVWRCTQWIPLS